MGLLDAPGISKAYADSHYAPTSTYRTKRVGIPVGSDCSGTNTTYADICTRNGIIVPTTTTRWRVRVANQGYSAANPYTGALTFTGVYVGTPSLSSDGSWGGAFTAAPTLAAAGGTTGADGSEYISPWVTDPALQFQAHQLTGISWGITCAAGTTLAYSPNRVGRTWFTAGAAAQAGNAAVPSGGNSPAAVFADVRIEYECTDTLPVALIIGDSTAAGVVDDSNLAFAIPGNFATWPGQAALRNNFHVINAGVSGTVYTDFATTRWNLKRFDLATTVPDVAILGCGINDANLAVSVTSWTTNVINLRSSLVAIGIKRTMIATVMQQPRWKAGQLLADTAVGATSLLTSEPYASGDLIDVGALTTNYEQVTASAASTPAAAGGYTTPCTTTTKAHLRGDTTGLPAETLRISYNRVAGRGIAGFESVIDLDGAIKPSDPLFPWWGTGSVHPGARAYSTFGALVRLT